ncbi:MAG TPA: plastocyanin/azurin family copper-binding protein [Solirubrobacterales bacterium]|nr:plastocyanin/azurin family copper-binding protein [Solirubrobacterales bacterium]
MKKLAALLVLGLVSAALVACGGDDDSTTTTATETGNANAGAESGKETGGGGGSTLEFEADPGGDLAYTTTEASAEAGKVTIDFNNPQSLTHDVAIEDSSGETVAQTDLIGKEETSTNANLKPGTYTFYCSVPGHREAGMEGTLTVK